MKQKGFTLLELIVVMVITSILLSGGILALIRLRESTKVNRAVDDFVSESKTYLSRARNSTLTKEEVDLLSNGKDYKCTDLTGDFVPDAMGIRFSNKEYEFIKCIENEQSFTYDYCCVKSTSNLYNDNLKDPNIEYLANCEGVLFEYSTGTVKSFASQDIGAIKSESNSCTVTITHSNLNYSKQVTFDTDNNDIQTN